MAIHLCPDGAPKVPKNSLGTLSVRYLLVQIPIVNIGMQGLRVRHAAMRIMTASMLLWGAKQGDNEMNGRWDGTRMLGVKVFQHFAQIIDLER